MISKINEDPDFLITCAGNEIRKSEADMIFLALCALKGIIPDKGHL